MWVNQSTVIRYSLPQTFRSAQIKVTNGSGQVVKQIKLTNAGDGSLTIEAGALLAGVYHYSLWVDDMQIDTKKMILTD